MTDEWDADDEDPTPDAVIVLRRGWRGARDLLRSYQVFLDGGELTGIRIGRGQTLEFDVLAGPHTVQLVVDQDSSRLVSIDLSAGGRASFVCGPARGREPDGFRIDLKAE